jgi:diguanylate cyclase (GGDEF)-like protein
MQHGDGEITRILEFNGFELSKKPYLVVMSGDNIGHRYQLSSSQLYIGRLYSTDIPLNEPNVSRRHACIEVRHNKIVIHDLDSTNGTFVNGERISSHVLCEGDLISIGVTTLKFAFQSEVDNAFYEEIVDSARHDVLTGLVARKFFYGYLQSEFARIERYGGHVSLLMCDLDDFKKLNDAHGHQAGDMVLSAVGKTIRSCIRQNIDVAGRYGGEEIVILLPEITLDLAKSAAEKVRLEIESLMLDYQGARLRVTMSIGVSASDARVNTPELLINAADNQLYLAKNKGKNRVE